MEWESEIESSTGLKQAPLLQPQGTSDRAGTYAAPGYKCRAGTYAVPGYTSAGQGHTPSQGTSAGQEQEVEILEGHVKMTRLRMRVRDPRAQ